MSDSAPSRTEDTAPREELDDGFDDGPDDGPGGERGRGGWRLAPAIAFLCLVHALLLHESLLGGKVLTQIDALLLFEPWASVAPEGFRASNELLLDQSLVVLPWTEFYAERLRAGELPLWNPHAYAGHPIAANPTGGLFWPLHWIYFAFPSWHYWGWSAWLRLVATGAFVLLFLRELGLGRPAATVGATAFSLCGFSVLWLNHPHTNVSMFLPLLLYFVERAARRPSLGQIGGFAITVGLVLVGGHVQTALHVALGAGLYAAFRAAVRARGTRLAPQGAAGLAIGAFLGVMIALPQLLPFAEYMAVSQGARLTAERDVVDAVEPLEAAAFLVAPDRHGHPVHGEYDGPLGAHINYQELAGGFVGRLALLLALVAPLAAGLRRHAAFFGGLALFAVLVACQVPPLYDALREVPLLQNTKLMRLFLWSALALSVLAAMGTEGLLARLRTRATAKRALGGTIAVVVALELGSWGLGYNPAIERDSPTFLPPTPVTDFLAEDPSLHRVVGQKGAMLLPNANLFYDVDTLTGYDAMELVWVFELVRELTTDPMRDVSIKEIRWFDRPLPLLSLLNVKYVLADAPMPPPLELVLDGPVRVYRNPDVLPRAFVAREVEVIEDAERRLERLAAPDFDPRIAVLEEPVGGVAPDFEPRPDGSPPGNVTIERYEPREVVLEATMDATGLVVIADAWEANWVARVDGVRRPLLRVDHALRGVRVEAGRHEVVLTHEPRSMQLGLLGAGAGLLACAVLAFVGRRVGRGRA